MVQEERDGGGARGGKHVCDGVVGSNSGEEGVVVGHVRDARVEWRGTLCGTR